MPSRYVRMTVTISACYHVTNSDKTDEEICREQEAEMMQSVQENSSLADKLSRLVAFAKVPGGTITWDCKPAKEPQP